MNRLVVTLQERQLVMRGPKGRESLELGSDYDFSPLARSLFSQLGTLFLVSPYALPEIETNFAICPEMRSLFAGMYKSLGKKAPHFFGPAVGDEVPAIAKPKKKRAAVAHGGGKDSLRNIWWAQEEYGTNNVLAVHISGLNRAVAKREHEYCDRQRSEIGFPNVQFIKLHNGSRSSGHEVMRARDFFLIGLIIPCALKFGASRIITEGYAETKDNEPYSGKPENMRFFNRLLRRMDIPVQVAWRDRQEIYAVKDLLVHRPDWLQHVANCFTPAVYFESYRRCWKRNAPTLGLYDSQCGSCPKCRTVNLARILYEKGTVQSIKTAHAQYFLNNTKSWMQRNRGKFDDFIDGSFSREFKRAQRRYSGQS